MEYRSIVLSGTPVSGKTTLAKELASEYGYERFSIGELWRRRYREECHGTLVSFEQFYAAQPPEESRGMNEEAKRMFESGRFIGESRIISYLDPQLCLRVFVTAALDVRAARAKGREEYKSMGIEDIKAVLLRREADEARVSTQLYFVDHRDPSTFELLVDTGALSVQQEVEMVRCMVNAKR